MNNNLENELWTRNEAGFLNLVHTKTAMRDLYHPFRLELLDYFRNRNLGFTSVAKMSQLEPL